MSKEQLLMTMITLHHLFHNDLKKDSAQLLLSKYDKGHFHKGEKVNQSNLLEVKW